MNKTAYYAKVTSNYDNTMDNKPFVEFIVIYATSFTDATWQIEEAYRTELLSFEIFTTDDTFHTITEKEFEEIKNESI